jgi:hypothetical protein
MTLLLSFETLVNRMKKQQKGVRQESRRNVSDMASVSSLDGGEGNINPMILAADEKAYRRLQSRGCLRGKARYLC